MDIEIYLPCKPDIVCEGLEITFAIMFVLGVLVFIVVLYREYKKINTPLSKSKRNRNKSDTKPN